MTYRTQYLRLGSDPDHAWLRDVAAHGRAVAVRFTGMTWNDRARQPDRDGWEIRSWEAAMRAITGKSSTAFLIVHMDRLTGCGSDFRWRDWLHKGERVLAIWREVRSLTGLLPTVLHVEDFAARWALEAGVRPEWWLMDNPMVSVDEARERWSTPLERPGLLRRSPLSQPWGVIGMHFPIEEWLVYGLPERPRVWDRRSVAALGPIGPVMRRVQELSNGSHRILPREHGGTG